jgi:phospholipid N-methyltransferase
MKQTAGFLKQFLLHPGKVGAVAPSSARLARLMVDCPAVETVRAVVEFGSGTGVFTERLHRKAPAGAVVFSIEINETFVAATRRKCPQALVYHDSATRVGHYLRQHGLEHCDCIVSGLPWGVFEEKLQRDLLDAVLGALRPGGELRTFAYLGGPWLPAGRRFRRLARERFAHVSQSPIIWANMPPAFIYYCRK